MHHQAKRTRTCFFAYHDSGASDGSQAKHLQRRPEKAAYANITGPRLVASVDRGVRVYASLDEAKSFSRASPGPLFPKVALLQNLGLSDCPEMRCEAMRRDVTRLIVLTDRGIMHGLCLLYDYGWREHWTCRV